MIDCPDKCGGRDVAYWSEQKLIHVSASSGPKQAVVVFASAPQWSISFLQAVPRAASKSSCRRLSCVDAAEDELRREVNMAVLSGATNRQVTLTWAERRC